MAHQCGCDPDAFRLIRHVGDTANFIETYDNPAAGTGKTLTPTGTVNDGNGGANYAYTFANNTTGVINAAAANKLASASSRRPRRSSTSRSWSRSK